MTTRRQEKIQKRNEEYRAFMADKRSTQIAVLEQAYNIGLKMYEDNKDKLTPEEIEKIEAMKAEQLAMLSKLKEEADAFNTRTEA